MFVVGVIVLVVEVFVDKFVENLVWIEVKVVVRIGLVDIVIVGQVMLYLLVDCVFIFQFQVGRLLMVMGNLGIYDELLGFVFFKGEGDWFVMLCYIVLGYVKDGDVKEWKVDELLVSYKEGIEFSNEE